MRGRFRARFSVMTSDARFTIGERGFAGLLEAAVEGSPHGSADEARRADYVLTLADVVRGGCGQNVETSSSAVQLAWFAYVLSVNGYLERPEEFPAKALLGFAVDGPQGDGVLLYTYVSSLQLACGPFDADELLGGPPPTTFDDSVEQLREVAQRIAEEGTELVAATIAGREPIDQALQKNLWGV
jgi:hypothetical protein